jgi:hypothetical protein
MVDRAKPEIRDITLTPPRPEAAYYRADKATEQIVCMLAAA